MRQASVTNRLIAMPDPLTLLERRDLPEAVAGRGRLLAQ